MAECEEARRDQGADELRGSTDHIKRDLLSRLRHDLRTPLNHIIGYSELLLETAQERGETDLVLALRKIQVAGSALLGRLDAYFDTSRTQIGAINLDPLSYDVRTQLNTIVGYSEMLCEEADALGYADFAADLGRVYAAGKQVLGGVNALLELNRTGLGATERVGPSDVAPAPRQETAVAPRPGRAAEATADAPTLLVVDDNEINRDVLSRRLRRLGYNVAQVDDGRAALERLRAEASDLVLLDVLMPGMNGFEVLDYLKRDATLREIPVIMLSAIDELESVAQCIQQGAEDYLVLPINAVLLSARIAACLERKRLRDQELQRLRYVEEALDAQQRANEQLEHLNKVRSHTVSVVSHELRTPLALVHGYAELLSLESRSYAPEDVRQMAREIFRGSSTMARMVDDLLDFARFEQGRLCLNLSETDLAAAIRGASEALADQPGGERLVLELPSTPLLARVDVDKVGQIVANFVSNALRYAPSGPVHVRLGQEPAGHAVVEVRDQGPGMSAEVLARVWEMFYRAPEAMNSPNRGVGIGLALVKNLVEAHGGTVEAVSAPGQGAVFRARFPLNGGQESSAQEECPPALASTS